MKQSKVNAIEFLDVENDSYGSMRYKNKVIKSFDKTRIYIRKRLFFSGSKKVVYYDSFSET